MEFIHWLSKGILETFLFIILVLLLPFIKIINIPKLTTLVEEIFTKLLTDLTDPV